MKNSAFLGRLDVTTEALVLDLIAQIERLDILPFNYQEKVRLALE
jgi:hypothetical protein